MLTHGNLLTNIDSITKGAELNSKDKCLSWLPLSHDMGLIGCHLSPLYNSMTQYIMPTNLFIRKPMLWMEKASSYKITILSSPNFGLKFFLKFFNNKKPITWDLSQVRIMFNGAELISIDLCQAFVNKLEKFKLNKRVLFPVYGLAEASLAVTFPEINTEIKYRNLDRNHLGIGNKIKEVKELNGFKLVDLGRPITQTEVEIRDNKGIKLNEDIIGFVYIRGNNVTTGYYNNISATQNTISNDGWLNTGDLGFLSNNSLTITGRYKETIIINGQNYYPQDIEKIVNDIINESKLEVAVSSFFTDASIEEMVLFISYRKQLDGLIPYIKKIKKHLSKELGLDLNIIVPVKKIYKTTSGKIQRYKLIKAYNDGTYSDIMEELINLQSLDTSTSSNSILDISTIEFKVLNYINDELQIPFNNIDNNLLESGVSSLAISSCISYIYKEFNTEISISVFFEMESVRDIINFIKLENGLNKDFPVIEKIEEKSNYPLSSAQNRLFLLNQFELSNSYNTPLALRITGPVDLKRIETTLHSLVQRHESLRTSFHQIENTLVQKINPNVDFKVEIIEEISQENITGTIQKLIYPFDLSVAPLLRASIIPTNNMDVILLFDAHHIIIDGTSFNIIIDEFIKLYRGDILENTKIKYKDFAQWQNNLLKSDNLKVQEEYWLNEFKGNIPQLNLPLDHPRTEIRSYKGKNVQLKLSKHITTEIDKYLMKHKITPFMFFLTSYSLLLSKYCGQEDIIIGSPVHGRTSQDLNSIVGLFVNTLAIRSLPNQNKLFTDYLQEIKQKVISGIQNQEYQFETLINKLKLKRDISRNPLFDTMLLVEDSYRKRFSVDDVNFEHYPYDTETSKFDLTLFVKQDKGYTYLDFEYSTDLFKEATMSKLKSSFEIILKDILNSENKALKHISYFNEDMKSFVMEKFNDTYESYPEGKSVSELFDIQVRKNPNKKALIFNDKIMTYDTLNRKSNSIGRILLNNKVIPETIVAIIMKPSCETIISILSVLKCGAAFLPIDPDLPADRISYMLEDCRTNTILTTREYANKVSPQYNIIFPEDNFQYSINDSDFNYDINHKPKNLAYVIYTSGSTGKPKGVMIENRSLINYLTWAKKVYFNNETSNFAFFTTISFDLTITSIFTPLISGESIFIFTDDEKSIALEKIVLDREVNIIKLTPSHLRILKEIDLSESNICKIIVGGEQLESELCSEITEKFPNKVSIYNEYGPTEAVVGCMTYKYDKEVDKGYSVPIGVPGDNVKIFILDKYLSPVPVNVSGEIYIAGDGLARGYLNDPQKTYEKFIENPYCDNELMYKTGDLARRLDDGNVEFLNRIDQQVKIRGYRIELGEIENTILEFNNIIWATVIDRVDDNGNTILCAYYREKNTVNTKDLIIDLELKLPRYMIPQHFILIEQVPLTQNGKLDKNALPKPKQHSGVIHKGDSEIENLIVNVWQEVLGIKEIGVTDNFFELGGDSIKAMGVVSRLNNHNIDINMKDVLTSQTIATLSKNINININKNSGDQETLQGELTPTPIMSWFLNNQFKNPNYFNQSVLLDLNIDLDTTALNHSIKKLLIHHDGLRMNYKKSINKFYFNNQHINNDIFVNKIDISGEDDQENILRNTCIDIKSSFNIEESLLIKFNLITTKKTTYLFMTAHHLIVDVVSWNIILQDLFDFYTGIKNKKDVNFNKTSSLLQWNSSLNKYKDGIDHHERSYWTENLASSFKLPVDNNISDWSNKYSIKSTRELSSEVTENLITRTNSTFNTTTEELIILSLVKALKNWSNQNEIAIEMENHGRHLSDINIANTTGWFTSMFPLKFNLEDDNLLSNITSVKETLRKVPSKGLGFGIFKYLENCPSLKSNLVSEVRFNYIGRYDSEVSNEYFTLSKIDTGSETCKTNNATTKLEVICMITEGKLQMEMIYNSKSLEKESIEYFQDIFSWNITQLISQSLQSDEVFLAPSDFELAEINQNDLDTIFN